MTTTWAPTWVREALPDDVRTFCFGELCRTCNQNTLSLHEAYTRSAEPDPDGQYHLQPHHDWCPVWTGETPELACPRCGAPVHSYDYSEGVSLEVPHALFGVAHLVGTAEEVYAHPDARYANTMAAPTLEPALSKTTVSPCGHVLKGSDALHVVTRAAELRAEKHRAEADQTIADAQQLLDAAEHAGQHALARAYREAVRGHAATAPGLLAALRLLNTTGGPDDRPATTRRR
jgi:hypothetical protein